MDPNDKSTWTNEKTNMSWHRHIAVSEFAPKAWAAMCELLGGEERISDSPEFRGWSDGFIVNLGKEGYSPDDELDLRGIELSFLFFFVDLNISTIFLPYIKRMF